MKKTAFVTLSTLTFVCLIGVAGPAYALDAGDFSAPESVAVDEETGSYFVSNINGSPSERDANGFISKISPDGLVTVLKFVEPKGNGFELHAPKGLAVLKGVLYAVDIDGVKSFNAETGAFVRFYDFAPVAPAFLNDIAVNRDGKLFVSDMLANRIYRFDPNSPETSVEVYKESPMLGQPNGLLFNRQTKGLMVVSWETGRLMEIDPNGHIKFLRKELGNLDGITADAHGNLYISNYVKGEIYVIPRWGRGSLSLFQSGLETPADISYDDSRSELLVPLMNQNRVTSVKAKTTKSARREARGPVSNIG